MIPVVVGSLLVWAGRALAQRAAGGVVPWAWTLLGEGALAVVPALLAYSVEGAHWAWLGVGVVTLGISLLVARRTDAAVADARLGARERQARQVLRRPSPPELERVRSPIGTTVDTEQLVREALAQLRAARRSLPPEA